MLQILSHAKLFGVAYGRQDPAIGQTVLVTEYETARQAQGKIISIDPEDRPRNYRHTVGFTDVTEVKSKLMGW